MTQLSLSYLSTCNVDYHNPFFPHQFPLNQSLLSAQIFQPELHYQSLHYYQ